MIGILTPCYTHHDDTLGFTIHLANKLGADNGHEVEDGVYVSQIIPLGTLILLDDWAWDDMDWFDECFPDGGYETIADLIGEGFGSELR